MKALITASFDQTGLKLLRDHMEVRYESYRETGKIYFDEEELARMKPSACLINTARSFLTDEEALLTTLKESRSRRTWKRIGKRVHAG